MVLNCLAKAAKAAKEMRARITTIPSLPSRPPRDSEEKAGGPEVRGRQFSFYSRERRVFTRLAFGLALWWIPASARCRWRRDRTLRWSEWCVFIMGAT